MRMQMFTPSRTAEIIFAMSGGNPSIQAVADSYVSAAIDCMEYAAKAKTSKSGKYRGYTEARSLELAAEMKARAESVPAELRKIMGL